MSVVFVIGTGRCGSSLLAELLAAHPDVTFVPEAGPRGVPRPSEAYELLEREVSQLVSAPCRDLTEQDAIPWVAERFRRFFEERLDAIPVDPSRCTAYEDDLGADCVRLLTASLSQHLERWGYPQRNPAG